MWKQILCRVWFLSLYILFCRILIYSGETSYAQVLGFNVSKYGKRQPLSLLFHILGVDLKKLLYSYKKKPIILIFTKEQFYT